MSKNSRTYLRVGAVLATLVGLLWLSGGVALYQGSPAAFPGMSAGRSSAIIVAIAMVIVGGALIAAAVSAFLRHRAAWPLGAAAAVAFAVDGFVSNYVLFGAVRLLHTLTDVAIAGVILFVFAKGRRALTPFPKLR